MVHKHCSFILFFYNLQNPTLAQAVELKCFACVKKKVKYD